MVVRGVPDPGSWRLFEQMPRLLCLCAQRLFVYALLVFISFSLCLFLCLSLFLSTSVYLLSFRFPLCNSLYCITLYLSDSPPPLLLLISPALFSPSSLPPRPPSFSYPSLPSPLRCPSPVPPWLSFWSQKQETRLITFSSLLLRSRAGAAAVTAAAAAAVTATAAVMGAVTTAGALAPLVAPPGGAVHLGGAAPPAGKMMMS